MNDTNEKMNWDKRDRGILGLLIMVISLGGIVFLILEAI